MCPFINVDKKSYGVCYLNKHILKMLQQVSILFPQIKKKKRRR